MAERNESKKYPLAEVLKTSLPPYVPVLGNPVFHRILAVGVKYWNKQGGKCLCEEQDKERLFSCLGIFGPE